jgi:hypothetical protein
MYDGRFKYIGHDWNLVDQPTTMYTNGQSVVNLNLKL